MQKLKFILPATILPRMKHVLGTDAYQQTTMKKFSSAKYPLKKVAFQNNAFNRRAIKLITENTILTLKRKGTATILKKEAFQQKKNAI